MTLREVYDLIGAKLEEYGNCDCEMEIREIHSMSIAYLKQEAKKKGNK